MNEKAQNKRIDIIDAARGIAVILMVIHHFLYDLVEFLGAPEWLFSNPVFNVLHYFFAGLFIFLSGVSSRFSRSNTARGIKVIVIAILITLVTTFMDMPIRFGVLHLLGFSMIFYGLTRKLWDSIPSIVMPILCVVLIVGTALAVGNIEINSKHLWMFGWTYPEFYSADYFAIFPWLFVFLFGTWAGKPIKDRKLPERFYTLSMPFFPAVGRKALIIYILHQPILYGITMLIQLIIK